MAEWQYRPLDRVSPFPFVDAINVKIRDGQVANRPAYVVPAGTVDGSASAPAKTKHARASTPLPASTPSTGPADPAAAIPGCRGGVQHS
ncbi:transposase [Streptomyces sp. ODS05-4]|uniref:transposase n=1 Tax=Streptomyces sp. ODS05-4 TaxID=2944939 RepID=UPI0035B44DDF